MIEALLSHCRRQQHEPRSTLIREGDNSETLYYIINGSVSVMSFDADGHEIVLAYLNAGDFFGEMGLFGETGARSAWVTTREASEIAEISYARFHEIAEDNPKVLYALAGQLAERLRQTNRKVLNLAFVDVTGRIAATLNELANQPDAKPAEDGQVINITRSELARVVGCSREMCSRVMKELEAQGLVTSVGRDITVHNPKA